MLESCRWHFTLRHLTSFRVLQIRSAAPLASQDQSAEAYRAALQAYERPANAYSRSTVGAGDARDNISAETRRAVFLCSVQVRPSAGCFDEAMPAHIVLLKTGKPFDTCRALRGVEGSS